jgi:hypothetical protein
MPANAVMDRVVIGATGGAVAGTGLLTPIITAPWFFPGDPVIYENAASNNHFLYYDWVFAYPPDGMPLGTNPSTGLAYTLDDLYDSVFMLRATWAASTASFGPPIDIASWRLVDIGVNVHYYGNSEGGEVEIPEEEGGGEEEGEGEEPPESPSQEGSSVEFPCIHGSFTPGIEMTGSFTPSHRLLRGVYNTEGF